MTNEMKKELEKLANALADDYSNYKNSKSSIDVLVADGHLSPTTTEFDKVMSIQDNIIAGYKKLAEAAVSMAISGDKTFKAGGEGYKAIYAGWIPENAARGALQIVDDMYARLYMADYPIE